MTEAATGLESLLREALAPVEPPAELVRRLEGTLTSITEMAADELEAWELSAMRDPATGSGRQPPWWSGHSRGRPGRAPGPPARTGGTARPARAEDSAERTVRDLEQETRRLLGER